MAAPRTREELARELEALRAERDLLSGIMQASPVGTLVFDMQRRLKFANPAAANALASGMEIIGRTCRQVGLRFFDQAGRLLPDDSVLFDGPLTRNEAVDDLNLGVQFPDGRRMQVLVNGVPLRNDEGEVCGAVLTVRDMTEYQRVVAALRASNQFNEEVITTSGEGIVVVDRDLRLVCWSRAMEEVTKLDSSGVIERSIHDVLIFSCEHAQSVREAFQAAFLGERVCVQEVRYSVAQTGVQRWASVSFGPHRDSHGEIVGAIATISDITRRKHAEEALREERRTLDTLMGNLPGAAYRCRVDKDWTMEYLSSGCQAFTGYRAEELMLGGGVSFGAIIHPDDRAYVENEIMESLRAGRGFQLEYRIRTADGREKWVWEKGCRVLRNDGVPLLEGFIEDITERRHATEALREAEQRYRGFIENSRDGFVLFDENGVVHEWNPGMESISGIGRPEAIGETLWNLSARLIDNSETLTAVRQSAEAHLSTEDSNASDWGEIPVDWAFVRPGGVRRIAQAAVFPVRSAPGNGLAGAIIRDVTEQRQSEEALRRYAERLEALCEVDRSALGALSLEDLAHSAVFHLRRLLDCQGAGIEIHDPRTFKTILFQSIGAGAGDMRAIVEGEVPVEYTHGKEVMLNGVRASTCPAREGGDHVSEVQSFLGVPLIAQGELIGSLNAFSVRPQFFDNERVEIARQLANHIALAVRQALLHGQVLEGNERLKKLTQRMVAVQESERRRLSRELHDEAGQSLTALKISLGLISEDIPPDMVEVRQRLSEVIGLADTTMEQLRMLAQDLRPPALDTAGLNLTLRDLCRDFARRTRLKVDYSGRELPGLSDEVSVCLYRVVQESLTNVAKHARADKVRVRLAGSAFAISVIVEDDGDGFDVRGVVSGTRDSGGLGLLGMRERLEMLGGRLRLQSRPGLGTRVICRIPGRMVT